MEIKIVEKKPEKLSLEILGETHTLLNLIRERSWKAKAIQASYMIKHPYLSEPKIIIRSKNPKKTLVDAAQSVMDDAVEFGKEFKRALKK